MAAHSADDGFHEIQLNGKQLVFLFMAATVVSVVIFLCGVLVGRGVRAERASTEGAALAGLPPDIRPAPDAGSPTPPAAGSDPTAAPPPTQAEDLSYVGRLEQPATSAGGPKPAPDREPASAPAPEATVATVAAAAAAPAAREPAASTPPVPQPRPAPVPSPQSNPPPSVAAPVPPTPGQAYAVQVAALNSRDEADEMAKRLSSKGYLAFVLAPASGASAVYRVRIGPYKTRREADVVAARLEKEERIKPWVAR